MTSTDINDVLALASSRGPGSCASTGKAVRHVLRDFHCANDSRTRLRCGDDVFGSHTSGLPQGTGCGRTPDQKRFRQPKRIVNLMVIMKS